MGGWIYSVPVRLDVHHHINRCTLTFREISTVDDGARICSWMADIHYPSTTQMIS